VSAPTEGGAGGKGLRQLGSEQFDALAAVGGVRGLVESVAPGVVFVAVFVATQELLPPVIAAVSVAVLGALVRLVQRAPITQVAYGLVGVGIGAIWAWRSGEASNFYAWGLVVNAVFATGVLVSILVRRPVVGVLASLLLRTEDDWRAQPALRRRYEIASWLWCGAFALRLAIQTPLFLLKEVELLGVARLVMGLPLWALVLWVTWLLVNPRAARRSEPGPPEPRPS
jgi:hypothetical protein